MASTMALLKINPPTVVVFFNQRRHYPTELYLVSGPKYMCSSASGKPLLLALMSQKALLVPGLRAYNWRQYPAPGGPSTEPASVTAAGCELFRARGEWHWEGGTGWMEWWSGGGTSSASTTRYYPPCWVPSADIEVLRSIRFAPK